MAIRVSNQPAHGQDRPALSIQGPWGPRPMTPQGLKRSSPPRPLAINVPLVPIPGAQALQWYADKLKPKIYSNYLKKKENLASNKCYQSYLTYNKITLHKAIQLYATYITQCRCSLLTTIYVTVILDTNFFAFFAKICLICGGKVKGSLEEPVCNSMVKYSSDQTKMQIRLEERLMVMYKDRKSPGKNGLEYPKTYICITL